MSIAGDYEKRLAEARDINSRPAKDPDPRQKLRPGTRVKTRDLDYWFPPGYTGVIVYSYAQKYGWMVGPDSGHDSYCLLVVDVEGKLQNRLSWRDDDDLEELPATGDEARLLAEADARWGPA